MATAANRPPTAPPSAAAGDVSEVELSEAGSPDLGSRSSGGSGRSAAEYSGWVYHIGVNSIGHEYCHLRFLVIRGKTLAMYKRDPHDHPGLPAGLKFTPLEPIKRKRVAKRSAPTVETEVRRSDRIKANKHGFKSAGCSNLRCTTCEPPTLSTKIIRNLGVQFCNMNPKDLTDDKLVSGGRKNHGPIAKKKGESKKTRIPKKDREDGGTDGGPSEGDP